MELPPTQILMLLASDDTLRQKTNEAMEIIVEREKNEAGECFFFYNVFFILIICQFYFTDVSYFSTC